jgi:hypothetical protein
MIKVVINACHGGFGLSAAAESKYKELAGVLDPDFRSRLIPRDDAHLIAVVELMGSKACGGHAELKIVEIPDDVNWYIEEYDGREWVAERHRTWE